VVRGQAAEVIIDERQELRGGIRLARPEGVENRGEVSHGAVSGECPGEYPPLTTGRPLRLP
jgi:hypothetical protein